MAAYAANKAALRRMPRRSWRSRLSVEGSSVVLMCKDYEQHVRWAEYRQMMQALELAVPVRQGESDLPQADDVRINDDGPIMRAAGNEIELVPMSFSFPPERPRSAPVFNFRSDGRHFANSTRCVVPTPAFSEFTGKKYPKAKHRKRDSYPTFR
jgi:putative SOS response-associated peptidase YedK